jgi:hypothetical protein
MRRIVRNLATIPAKPPLAYPIRIRSAPIHQALEKFLAHLARWSNGKRERRAAVFYRNLQADAA